jgi:hypothetical protein
MRPRWAWLLLASMPLPALAWSGGALADWAAKRGATLVDRAAHVALPARARPVPATFVEPEVEAVLEAPAPGAEDAVLSRRVSRVPSKGIRVRAEAVLRLANAGARPSGIPVPPKGSRPAGVALVGVSGLGVGLIDGDVLTHADGRPARSAADVIGVVIGARAQHAREICGRFWRNGEAWNLIVEQPYVSRPSAAESSGHEPDARLARTETARRPAALR